MGTLPEGTRMTQATFRAYLLFHFSNNEDAEAHYVAIDLTTGQNGLAGLDGAPLRDYLCQNSEKMRQWAWAQWNNFNLWQSLVARLPAETPPPLTVYDLIEFRVAEFPKREPLMAIDAATGTPVFTKQSINQIFAWRGTGKSMTTTALVGAMATGGKFLNMQASRKVKVLYAEGEMPNDQMQQRVNLLVDKTDPGYSRLITLDSQPNGIPPLKTIEGRKAIEDALEDAEVLVLDSVSSLAWIKTNEEEEWFDFLQWLIRLRSRGLCIIFLHHAGKSGLQRGHSKSEDALDVSIKLTADESEERDYLKFKFEFDKFRSDRRGLRALSVDFKAGTWRWEILETEKLEIVREYLTQHPGASSRTIAKARPDLGSHATVAVLMRKVVSID